MGLAERILGNINAGELPQPPVYRAPILWVLFPQIIAYLLCEIGFEFPQEKLSTLALGVLVGAASALGFAILNKFSPKKIFAESWKILFAISLLFFAGIWWSKNAPPIVDLDSVPETEVYTRLEIQKLFRSRGKSWTGIAKLKKEIENPKIPKNTQFYFQISKSEFSQISPFEGMQFEMRAILSGINAPSNLSDDFKQFLIKSRISGSLRLGDSVKIRENSYWGEFRRYCATTKQEICSKITSQETLLKSQNQLLCAMLFGEYSLLSPEQMKNFRNTGTLHFFAISGLHVAILAGFIFICLRFTPFPFEIIAGITSLILFIYIVIAGIAPSSLRAWLMVSILFAGRILGRRGNSAQSLPLAASLTLWLFPQMLTNLGFQLSYIVVVGILAYGVPLNSFLESKIKFFPWTPKNALKFYEKAYIFLFKKSLSLFTIALSAFLSGTCLIAGSFGVITPISICINIFLVPICILILCLAFVGACLTLIPNLSALAEISTLAGSLLAYLAEVITATCAECVPVISLDLKHPAYGILGSCLVLSLILAGTQKPLNTHPYPRFLIPLAFLCVYLLAFAI